MKNKISCIFLLLLITQVHSKRPYVLNLTTQDPTLEVTMTFDQNQHDNIFELKIEDIEMMTDNKLYLIMESNSKNLYLSILGDNSVEAQSNVIMDLTTMTGNLMMIMSDTFFKGHLDFFKTSKALRFKVKCHKKNCDQEYKIKAQIQEQGELTAGQIYTTRIDQSLKNIQVLMSYDGEKNSNLHKLRFQLHTIKKSAKFSLSAKLIDHTGSRYILNELYKDTVGGLIDEKNFDICKLKNCDYTLKIDLEGVKTMNIESFLGKRIEELSFDHYGPYYEKTYSDNQEVSYILLNNPEVKGMDISISLIPVTAHTGLYVNTMSKPGDYASYDWSETSPLAKRITIKNEELVLMKAENADLYVTVNTKKAGEYLIKIDAHEPGIQGRLHDGVIEDGFVLAEEISNYIYMFEIFKSQEIEFSVKMNISSGDADLYMKQCSSLVNCKIDLKEDKDLYKVTNNHNNKIIDHKFNCNHDSKYQATICNFAIGVVGKENNGSHYNLVLHQSKSHRLITPGHSVKFDLDTEDIQYLKFSYPNKSSYDAKLFIQIEAIWGNFNVFISKTNQYPDQNNHDHREDFYSSQTGLYNSLKTVEMNFEKIKESRIEGTYYIAINAITSCSVNIKFYEADGIGINIHSLYAGEQQRGSLKNSRDIIYYSIIASLDKNQASSITIDLTPLKGKFLIFTSRKGKIPTKDDFDLISKNNTLELSYDDYQNQEEHIIGVQLLDKNIQNDSEFQFNINFNYSNKPLKLKPGIISNFFIQKKNIYLIEITVGMIEFLILKGNNDGYNVSVCANFVGSENNLPNDENCIKKTQSKEVVLHFNEDEVSKNCQKLKEKEKCFILLSVTGDQDQAFTLGYTFNDHPFQISQEQMIYGPNIQKGDHKINFVLHLEKQKSAGLYFNSKGLNMNVYTKLISGEEDGQNRLLLPFPSKADQNEENRVQRGHSTNIYYSEEEVSKYGENPEMLISVRPNIAVDKLPIYDGKNYFIMQSAFDSRQILRTETLHELLNEEEYYYYHFYNNGSSGVLHIQVSSNQQSLLEVMISRNLQSRPPFNDNYLVKENGIGKVQINLDEAKLAEKTYKKVNLLKGYYTIAVKSSESTFVNVYWNNKEEFDYVELTPGTPTTFSLNEKTLFFSFFAQDIDPAQKSKEKGTIRLFFKSDARANIYVLASSQNELKIPGEDNSTWKTQIPKRGGIAMLEILPSDPNYCLDCTYIASFESISTGQVTILADIEHDDIPIFLTPGFTFPELLNPKNERIYRIYNPDTDALNLQFSILSGSLQVFISNDEKNIRQSKQTFEIDELRNRYKFFKIRPSDFSVKEPSDYFILIKNRKNNRASFNLQLVKNTLKTPIEPGLTKSVFLGEKESSSYFFKTKNVKRFQVYLEITNIYNEDQMIQLTEENLEVFSLVNQSQKFKIQHRIIGKSDNKLYFECEVSPLKQEFIILEVYNNTNKDIQYNIHLRLGGYKMVNLDEFNVEHITKGENQIYEVFGKKGEFLFFDMRMCYGNELQVSFYQNDYNKVSKKEFSDYKTIKDSHSIINYITLEHERLFIKVSLPRTSTKNDAVFNLNIFNQRHLDDNPYTSITHQNDGIVKFDTIKMQVTVDPIFIQSNYSEEFKHRITYTLYLSKNIQMMKYAKNCDEFFIENVQIENDLKVFKKSFDYDTISKVNQGTSNKIEIKVNEIDVQQKYYGIVIVKVDLFSNDNSLIKPVKSGRAYYDEFIIITQKWNFSFFGILGIIMIIGLLYCTFLLINQYVFGSIGKYQNFTKLSDLTKLENEASEYDTTQVLESEFFMNDSQEEEVQEQVEKNPHEFELTTNQI